MKKVIIHLVLFLLIFGGTWFIFRSINFVGRFGMEEIGKDTEKKVGEVVIESLRQTEEEVFSDSVVNSISAIKERICKANKIDPSKIEILIFKSEEVNAFALPGNKMVLYTGLIKYSKNPEEIAGVMSHEIAHMEAGHVMKKLGKEVGLSLLLSIAGGDASPNALKQIVELITSSAFDRDQETEADTKAVTYMAKASIDPENLATFLIRISAKSPNETLALEWFSTHPESKKRAAEIFKLRKLEKFKTKALMSNEEFENIKEICSRNE
jgi:predicted Zn-dependent protease